MRVAKEDGHRRNSTNAVLAVRIVHLNLPKPSFFESEVTAASWLGLRRAQPSTHSVGDISDATVLARRIVTSFALGSELDIPIFTDIPNSQVGSVYNQWKKFSGQVRMTQFHVWSWDL